MFACSFKLAVLGTTGDKFGFTIFRNYLSKSEFYDVSSKTNVRIMVLKAFAMPSYSN